jgi:hypothetical protein
LRLLRRGKQACIRRRQLGEHFANWRSLIRQVLGSSLK